MKTVYTLLITLCAALPLSAETVTAHYYGSEIDLNQKNNPCKGDTDGGIEVIVVTKVTAVKDAANRTMVERTYSLPNGEILKSDQEIINSSKQEVLHKLFPREYPKVKM